MLRVSMAQGGSLHLDFHVHFIQNRSKIVTRGFLRMLNKNIISPEVYEVPSAQGGPGWTSPPGVLYQFRSELIENRYSGFLRM